MSDSREQPIFILGNARSGTTLLRYALDTHPKVCSPPETGLGGLVEQLLRVSAVVRRAPTWQDPPVLPESIAEVRTIVSALMEEYCRRTGKSIWCEKSPGNVNHLDAITRVFPSARFLCLHRHCLDVAHSQCEFVSIDVDEETVRRRAAEIVNGVDVRARDQAVTRDILSRTIVSWCRTTERLLELERAHPSQCHRITFERLVTDPADVLQQLFAFLGLEWHVGLVDEIYAVHHDFGGGDPKAFTSQKISPDRVGKGRSIPRSDISADALEQMNRVLERVGYPPVDFDRANEAASESPGPSRPDEHRSVETQVAIDRFKRRLRARRDGRPDDLLTVGGTVKFVLAGDRDAVFRVDPAAPDGEILAGDGPAACTLFVSSGDLVDIIEGALNAGEAFARARLRVKGPLGMAMRLCHILFGGRPDELRT